MPRLVPGSGNRHPIIFIVGERPGREEHLAGKGFVGPAGQELWAHLRRITGLRRRDCWVTNLVKTFSPKPPTPAEIARDAPLLRVELLRVRPTLIITIGYHAARYFLPQFAEVNGDVFHGLVFPYEYGSLRHTRAIVVPVVHTSAALRQPARYQDQLVSDLAMVATVVHLPDAERITLTHRVQRVDPCQVGLATVLHHVRQPRAALGLDTEGYVSDVQAVTVAAHPTEAACVETWQIGTRTAAAMTHVQAAIDQASSLDIHHAKHDWQVLHKLGITPRRVRCTMLMAYLLQQPQSLKVLAYRLLGWQMCEYDDLVQPLDDTVVRSTLKEAYEKAKPAVDQWKAQQQQQARQKKIAPPRDAARRHRGPTRGRRHPATRGVSAQGVREAAAGTDADAEAPPPFPPRALTSIHGLLIKAAQDTLRRRWSHSTFAPHVPLPPAPTWKDVPPAERIDYALTDALAHRAVAKRLWPKIIARDLQQVYRIDMGVLPFLVRNEEVGMAVDADQLRRLSARFGRQFTRACEQIDQLAGKAVNPLSGEQVSDCLFDQLGITPTRPTKSRKHYTTADKYLKARKLEHRIIPLILRARKLNKYRGTYTEKLPSLLRDGRYYPNWKYTRTATGRLAEEVILLIPKHDDDGKAIRNCFHATEGHQLVSVDLSQIELRVMAHMSQDKRLLRAFERGEDVHAQVAHELLGAPKGKQNQDESLHRLPAKTINFGIINGMTEYGMLDQLHEAGQLQWTIEQVQELLDDWFRLHYGVAAWWTQQVAHAKAKGYVKDMFGRRRYLAALHSTSEQVVREAERQTLFAIQSGADGISKVWNRRIWQRVIVARQQQGQYCEPWVRVHDDTTLEVDRRHAKAVSREMLQLVPDLLCVPTTAEAKTGVQWGDLH